MTETYKSINHLIPSPIWEFYFHFILVHLKRVALQPELIYMSWREACKLQSKDKILCKLPMIKIKEFGQESLSIRRSFISNTLNDSVKNEPTLSVFTKGIFWCLSRDLLIRVHKRALAWKKMQNLLLNFLYNKTFFAVNSWLKLEYSLLLQQIPNLNMDQIKKKTKNSNVWEIAWIGMIKVNSLTHFF